MFRELAVVPLLDPSSGTRTHMSVHIQYFCALMCSCGSEGRPVIRRFPIRSQILQLTCQSVLEQDTESLIAPDAAPSVYECANS